MLKRVLTFLSSLLNFFFETIIKLKSNILHYIHKYQHISLIKEIPKYQNIFIFHSCNLRTLLHFFPREENKRKRVMITKHYLNFFFFLSKKNYTNIYIYFIIFLCYYYYFWSYSLLLLLLYHCTFLV